MSELERAAERYVIARYHLRGADPASLLERICAVDWAWHELTVAAGAHDPECCGCFVPELEERVSEHERALYYAETGDDPERGGLP